jgi:serine/threonine protein kinase
MRHVAAGLAQLHYIRVAHQDIKPSNAVAFVDRTIKITDLGSSSCEDMPPAPHDDLSYCGQPNYAPLELLYSSGGTWYRRRVGCDMYLLGNLVFTSFVGESITYVIAHAMPDELRHTRFTGDYDQVLPMLVDIHLNFVPLFLQQTVPEIVCEELTRMVLEMCHPDPERRGHPINRMGRGARYGLERYISAFDRMSLICARSERHA